MKIEYYKREVYCAINLYVLDGHTQAIIQKLTSKKTISHSDINALEMLGHELVEVVRPL